MKYIPEMNERYKPCPFCGGQVVRDSFKVTDKDMVANETFYCQTCGVEFIMNGNDFNKQAQENSKKERKIFTVEGKCDAISENKEREKSKDIEEWWLGFEHIISVTYSFKFNTKRERVDLVSHNSLNKTSRNKKMRIEVTQIIAEEK